MRILKDAPRYAVTFQSSSRMGRSLYVFEKLLRCKSFEREPFPIPSLKIITEMTKNGYTRSSNNHFRAQRKSSTTTPPGRPLIGRTTVVPGSGSKQSGCTRCAELMFRSTRYWLPLYPDLVRSVQATRRRAHTPTRARVHTRISE